MASVDNFQGEDNKIILLSLVRSNADYNIGYIGKEITGFLSIFIQFFHTH